MVDLRDTLAFFIQYARTKFNTKQRSLSVSKSKTDVTASLLSAPWCHFVAQCYSKLELRHSALLKSFFYSALGLGQLQCNSQRIGIIHHTLPKQETPLFKSNSAPLAWRDINQGGASILPPYSCLDSNLPYAGLHLLNAALLEGMLRGQGYLSADKGLVHGILFWLVPEWATPSNLASITTRLRKYKLIQQAHASDSVLSWHQLGQVYHYLLHLDASEPGDVNRPQMWLLQAPKAGGVRLRWIYEWAPYGNTRKNVPKTALGGAERIFNILRNYLPFSGLSGGSLLVAYTPRETYITSFMDIGLHSKNVLAHGFVRDLNKRYAHSLTMGIAKHVLAYMDDTALTRSRYFNYRPILKMQSSNEFYRAAYHVGLLSEPTLSAVYPVWLYDSSSPSSILDASLVDMIRGALAFLKNYDVICSINGCPPNPAWLNLKRIVLLPQHFTFSDTQDRFDLGQYESERLYMRNLLAWNTIGFANHGFYGWGTRHRNRPYLLRANGRETAELYGKKNKLRKSIKKAIQYMNLEFSIPYALGRRIERPVLREHDVFVLELEEGITPYIESLTKATPGPRVDCPSEAYKASSVRGRVQCHAYVESPQKANKNQYDRAGKKSTAPIQGGTSIAAQSTTRETRFNTAEKAWIYEKDPAHLAKLLFLAGVGSRIPVCTTKARVAKEHCCSVCKDVLALASWLGDCNCGDRFCAHCLDKWRWKRDNLGRRIQTLCPTCGGGLPRCVRIVDKERQRNVEQLYPYYYLQQRCLDGKMMEKSWVCNKTIYDSPRR